MIINYKNYQIRSFQNFLCYEIFEYRKVKNRKDGSKTDKWVSLGKYPVTLAEAFSTIYELMLNKNESTLELADAIDEANKIKNDMKKYMSKVEKELKDAEC